MESALYWIFTLAGEVSEISLVRCAHSFDTAPTRVKIPYARAFHEVISIFKIELFVRLSVSRLFLVGHVVQNWRCALSLAWHEWFHEKAKNKRFTAASSRCRQNLTDENFPSMFGRLRKKNSIKKRAAQAKRLLSLIEPIKSLIRGVVVVVHVVCS